MNDKKIFIVGNSRSGTTMLSRVFDRHSDVFAFNELHCLDSVMTAEEFVSDAAIGLERREEILRRLFVRQRNGLYSKNDGHEYRSDVNAICANADGLNAAEVYEAFMHHETSQYDKKIPCKQSPYYLSYVNEIAAAYPDAFFIFMVRDPRAVAASQKSRWKRNALSGAKHPLLNEVLRSWANYHPYITSKIWAGCVNRANGFSLGDRFIYVKYEDLAVSPRKTITKITNALEIEFQEDMLLIPQVGSSHREDKKNSLGIDSSRIQDWMNNNSLSDTEISIIQNVCAREMREFGYTPVDVKNNYFGYFISAVTACGKATISIVLNIRRSGNIIKLFKRRLNL